MEFEFRSRVAHGMCLPWRMIDESDFLRMLATARQMIHSRQLWLLQAHRPNRCNLRVAIARTRAQPSSNGFARAAEPVAQDSETVDGIIAYPGTIRTGARSANEYSPNTASETVKLLARRPGAKRFSISELRQRKYSLGSTSDTITDYRMTVPVTRRALADCSSGDHRVKRQIRPVDSKASRDTSTEEWQTTALVQTFELSRRCSIETLASQRVAAAVRVSQSRRSRLDRLR